MTTPAVAPTTTAAPAPAVPASSGTEAAAAAQREPVPAAKPEPASKIRVRGYERAKNLKAKLEAEEGPSTSEPAAERETAASPEPRQSSSAADSEADEPKTEPAKAAEPDAAEKRRAERAERILKAQARERAEHAERETKKRTTQRDTDRDRDLESMRKKLAELEPLNSVFESEDALLSAAEAKGMSAEKLAQWMRTRLTDPKAVAERQAQTVEQKLQAKLDEMQKRIDQSEKDRRDESQRIESERQAQHRAHSFLGSVRDRSESHPLTAALQKKYGDSAVIGFANQFVAPLLREDYSLDELHDHIEQILDEVQVGGASPPGTPANGTSHPAKNGAAQPPNTLSNQVASERVSVTEVVPLHRLPRQVRHQQLREKYSRE